MFPDLAAGVRAGELSAEEAADRLIAEMTDAELLWLLDGDVPVRDVARLPAMIRSGPVTGGAVARLGVPGVRFSDGPRGVVMGESTSFPVTMARAATWDPALEEQVGLAMGREARALGANCSGAVCVNLLRHPAWGRAQECYGEDPVLTGRMGAALTRGLRRNVMACVKHFALNSIENTRFTVDVTVDEHALHEVYLPHFRAVLAAGADSVMTAYNRVNGVHCDQNRVLLTDILRDEWGFAGFVTSDWVWGTHDAVSSLEAGLDVEMPLRVHRARELPAALRDGRVPRATVLRSARRILATQLRHEAGRDEAAPVDEPGHRVLAHRVAVQGTVLLRNEPVGGEPALPLPPAIRRLAVVGPLAAAANLGDRGSSLVHPPAISSILDGLRAALPGCEIGSDPAAAGVEAAVVVVGLDHRDEGERIMSSDLGFLGFPFTLPPVRWLAGKLAGVFTGLGKGGDRERLTLSDSDEQLIRSVAAAHPRTVVVVVGGSAILMEAWRERVPAILLAWYPGMEGGRAVADILTGAAEPGGRLPLSIPTTADHLPPFDAAYDSRWGQRKLDRDGHPAAFPFGFGLGYTTFTMDLVEDRGDVAAVRVANTGARAGSTVVQVYAVGDDRVPQLVGFRRVTLPAGASETVDVELDRTPTRERDPATRTWRSRPGRWRLLTAPHSPGSLT